MSASREFQASSSRTTSTSSVSSSSQRVVKLKDSCVRCATSKIKCTKEKPSCTRCLKKGITCEYDVSRRYGRISVNQPCGTTPSQPSQASSDGPRTPLAASPDCNVDVFMGANWLDAGHGSHDSELDSYLANDIDWDTLLSTLNTVDPHCNAEQTYSAGSDGGDGAIVAFDFANYTWPVFDDDVAMADIQPDAGPQQLSFGIEHGHFANDTGALETNAQLGSQSPASSGASPATFASSHHCLGRASTRCVQIALNILQQVYESSPDTCCSLNGNRRGANFSSDASISRKMANDPDGKLVLSTLGRILECPCAWNDSSLLTIVALVILKELSLCGIVGAASKPSAQAVMTELNEMRRLIHTWSLRIAEFQNPFTSALNSNVGTAMFGHSLAQLQTDLWAAVNRVSTETIEVMRRR